MKIFYERKVTGYLWHIAILAVLIGLAQAVPASDVPDGPTTMVVSAKPSNQIMAIRNYAEFDNCRADREFIISLLERFGVDVWVTCTPVGME